MVAGGRFELPSLAYETKLDPTPVYPAIKLGCRRWNRTISLSLIGRPLDRRALRQWIPAGDLNSPVSLTEAADRHLSLPGTTMEPSRRIELRYAGYESAALPTELTRQTLEPDRKST